MMYGPVLCHLFPQAIMELDLSLRLNWNGTCNVALFLDGTEKHNLWLPKAANTEDVGLCAGGAGGCAYCHSVISSSNLLLPTVCKNLVSMPPSRPLPAACAFLLSFCRTKCSFYTKMRRKKNGPHWPQPEDRRQPTKAELSSKAAGKRNTSTFASQ